VLFQATMAKRLLEIHVFLQMKAIGQGHLQDVHKLSTTAI
jgi:hypothetical protein